MQYEINEKLHGFTVTRVRYLDDCAGNMVEMRHDKTGAEVVYIDREIENKTFTIAFKTIPENDTGVFHILEHSVLNGSDRFPVKEPFVNLLKSSLQTYLNALTYPDKTMYPVSSRNMKDFMNLMTVYLDAVFHPAIYHEPNIFYQEGWHYEIRDAEKDPVYKGVVYSEMQGAFSNVDEMVMGNATTMLFPDNCYRFESGGDPDHIPELSYEQFLDAHRTYYHPSNSRIFLDGNMDLDIVLKKIDEEYLSHYDYKEMNFTIPMQKEIAALDRVVEYEISPEDETENRSHVVMMKIVCDYTDVEKIAAWGALADVLVGTNESPLKKAILEKNLGQDVELALIDGIQQPFFLLMVRNTEPEKKEEITAAVYEVVEQLVNNGLNHNKIKATLNQMEFKYREPHEPSGVIFVDEALKSWLYGGDPALYLNCSYVFEQLRQKADNGYFEQLLEDCLLDKEHISLLTVVPSHTLGEERRKQIAEKLQKEKNTWGNKLEEYIHLNEKLDLWQEKKDTEEDLATLPKLSLSDVNPKPRAVEPVEKKVMGIPVLLYPEEVPGIAYMNLYFSLAGIRKQDLPAMAFFASLFQDLPLKTMSVEELQEDVRGNLGSLSFGVTSTGTENDMGLAIPAFVVNCSALKSNLSHAVDLILKVLRETVFEPEQIHALLAQSVQEMRDVMISSGHSLAMLHCASQWSSSGVATEYMAGYTAIKWAVDFLDHFEERIEDFLEQVEMFREILLNANRLTVSVSSEDNLKEVERLIDQLPRQDFIRCAVRYPLETVVNSGIVIPAQVSYSAMYGSLGYNKENRGTLYVLSQILSYDYLWNEVRTKGGAYGTGFNAGISGGFNVYTYRDPEPAVNRKRIEGIGEYLRNFEESEEALTSYVIGTIANAESLVSPGGRIRGADQRWFAGIDYATRCRNREQILSACTDHIREMAESVEEALKKASLCIVGSEEVIRQSGISEENILRLSDAGIEE